MENPERLLVYRKSVILAREVFDATRTFPPDGRSLKRQCWEAAESIGANISEGCGRKNSSQANTELIRYLHVSLGSARELHHRIRGAVYRRWLSRPRFYKLDSRTTEVERMLTSLIETLETRDRGKLPPKRKRKKKDDPQPE